MQSLFEIVQNGSKHFPNKAALSDAEISRTYEELHEVALSTVATLQQLGIQPGDRVALCINNSVMLLEIYFSILASGATVVLLDAGSDLKSLKFIIEDCECSFIFLGEAQASRVLDKKLFLLNSPLKAVILTGLDADVEPVPLGYYYYPFKTKKKAHQSYEILMI